MLQLERCIFVGSQYPKAAFSLRFVELQKFIMFSLSELCQFLQYYQPEGVPTRHLESDMCALCGNKFLVKVGEEGVVENTYRLSCGHE